MARANLIDTGFQDIVAADNAADLSNPLTGPILAYTLKNVKLAAELRAIVGLKMRVGIQFSNNPMEFTDTPKELSGTYWNTAGWNRSNTAVDLFNLTGTTPRVWLRFVALTQTPSGTVAGSAEARIQIAPEPIRSQRVQGPWRKVNTRGSDSSYATHPVTGAIDVLGFTEQRVIIEVADLSGSMGVTVVYQETNTPDDPTSWTDVGTVGSELTASGMRFPTAFSATAFTMRWGRWAVAVRNGTGGTDIEACRVAVIVEIRE
jgi:hypothetical protein